MASGSKPRTRRIFFFLLLLVLVASAAVWPSTLPWLAQRTLRPIAERRGLVVGWRSIEGSIFDVLTIHGLRLRGMQTGETATDLEIDQVEITLRLSIPYFRPAESWAHRVVVDGVQGRYVVRPTAPVAPAPGASSGSPAPPVRKSTLALWLPDEIELHRVDAEVMRGNLAVRLGGLRVVGDLQPRGFASARSTEFIAGTRRVVLPAWHGESAWRRPRLSLSRIGLGNGVRLVSAALDVSRVTAGSMEAELVVEALSGTVRGSVSADFTAERPVFSASGTLQNVGVEPVARLLGGNGPFAGSFDQGKFSFRGDPGEPLLASSSLSVQAREFRWKERRFESLAATATLVNRRVQVQQFELKQAGNAVIARGETVLPERENPASAIFGRGVLIPLMNGFTLALEAQLDDLEALGQLVDPGFRLLQGRARIDGQIKGRLGDLDGWLNVQSSGFVLNGLPVDFLKATLGFKGEEIALADLQASAGKSDFLSAKGTWQPLSSGRYGGELKGQIADLGRYASVYVGPLVPGPLAGALRFDWSGDGTSKAHSGVFKAAIEKFSAKRANAKGTFARPVDLSAEGSYSPQSLAFRSFVLREGKRDALKLEGSLPWLPDRKAWSEGRLLAPTGNFSAKVEANEAPLDLLPFFLAGLKSADGRASGKFEVSGTRAAPRLQGGLKLKGGAVEWNGVAPALKGLGGEVKFDGAGLEASGLAVEIAGIDLTGGGKVRWDAEDGMARFDLTLKAEEVAWLDTKDANLEADLDLRLTGPADAIVLGGEVRFTADSRFFHTLQLDVARPSERQIPIRAGLWLPKAWFGEGAALGSRGLDLRLHTPKPIAVEAAGGGQLSLDLRFNGQARSPQVAGGEIRVTKTRLTAPAAPAGQWEVENAVFTFATGAAAEAEPSVTMVARRTQQKTQFTLNLNGTAATIATQPPVTDEAAPLRWLYFGVPLDTPAPGPELEWPSLRLGWKK
ncbi:MAG: translocation/assembly module TamB domain-containing protein [Verrucomicrobia bacterium]|nr:translocation/assembly module TamB domain-containing protein [Verrucomicrobiota bacterium]